MTLHLNVIVYFVKAQWVFCGVGTNSSKYIIQMDITTWNPDIR
jgi:hypothetical protein